MRFERFVLEWHNGIYCHIGKRGWIFVGFASSKTVWFRIFGYGLCYYIWKPFSVRRGFKKRLLILKKEGFWDD